MTKRHPLTERTIFVASRADWTSSAERFEALAEQSRVLAPAANKPTCVYGTPSDLKRIAELCRVMAARGRVGSLTNGDDRL